MKVNIYKDMILDSPIAYLHIKLIKDELGKFKSIEVKNYNLSYERIFLNEQELKVSNINKVPEDEETIKKWISFLDNIKVNKKGSVQKYIDQVDAYFNIDIYYEEINEYHIRLNKISNQDYKLPSVLKNAPFYVWMKDRNGVYLDANKSYLEFLEKTYEEVVGKTSFDILEKDRAKRLQKEEEGIIKQNKLVMYEDTIMNPEHLKGYYQVFKCPFMDKEDMVTLGTFGIVLDTTENVNLRKRLEDTEKQFLEIANNINDVIIIRDEKKAQYINSAFEKIYKFKPDELYEDIDKWYDYWDKIEFDTEPKSYNYDKPDECTLKVSKEGQDEIWLWNRFVPIFDEKGNISKKIGIISDITEAKQIEQEIDKMKMDFFTNLSHELRTPINLVLSTLQVLDLRLDSLDYETREYFVKYMRIIGQNGKRLLKLVNNLIDSTRLDAGCFSYDPKNNDIIKCIEDICTSISTFVKNNNMDIIFDTSEEEKIVAFDQDHMERIILNLISNAIKFNHPNGKIEVTINCEEDIKISVKDTGIGIPKENIDSIFGRFEQVKTKFNKVREGSGIGLSLVKSLVEMHGGSIKVNSIVGEGSEFIITLPDVLVESKEEDIFEINTEHANNINRMEIEFSDIYN